jgi:hypothetical protein
MDVSLLRLKRIFRHAAGKKGTLLAQALRRPRAQREDRRSENAADVRPPVNAESVKDPEKAT